MLEFGRADRVAAPDTGKQRRKGALGLSDFARIAGEPQFVAARDDSGAQFVTQKF